MGFAEYSTAHITTSDDEIPCENVKLQVERSHIDTNMLFPLAHPSRWPLRGQGGLPPATYHAELASGEHIRIWLGAKQGHGRGLQTRPLRV